MIHVTREAGTTNAETVRELYDSFAKGDFEAIRDITDPDVALHEPKGLAGGGTHHGFDEIDEPLRDERAERRHLVLLALPDDPVARFERAQHPPDRGRGGAG